MGRKKGKGGSSQSPSHSSHAPAGIGFVPPGVKGYANNEFGRSFERHFVVPPRIAHTPTPLIEAVNDFHFAMVNDATRNAFYDAALRRVVTPSTGVLEIGAGSGLLSIMAAKHGAKWVVAVEGSREMCELARANVRENGLHDRVHVLHRMSTELLPSDLPEAPDVVVSEILGTLMLGESAHEYLDDVRRRIMKPSTVVIPQRGIQYAVPIECPALDTICGATSWNGVSLRPLNSLRDTCSVVFTKKYGFRLCTVPHRRLSDPLPLLEVDFSAGTLSVEGKEKLFPRNVARFSGTATAMLYFWTVTHEELTMTTDPAETVDNFPRDMQWGQALQLLDADELGGSPMPQPVQLKEGTEFNVVCRYSSDHVILQCAILPIASGAVSSASTK